MSVPTLRHTACSVSTISLGRISVSPRNVLRRNCIYVLISITMGIRGMPWDEWIELDQQYTAYHRIRAFRIRTRGRDAVRVLPSRNENGVMVGGGGDAGECNSVMRKRRFYRTDEPSTAKELLFEIAEYLARRYPSDFVITRYALSEPHPQVNGLPLGWDGLPPIRTVKVVATDRTYELHGLEDEAAMRTAALL